MHWNRVHTVTGAKRGLQGFAWSSRASCKAWIALEIDQCNVAVGMFRRCSCFFYVSYPNAYGSVWMLTCSNLGFVVLDIRRC